MSHRKHYEIHKILCVWGGGQIVQHVPKNVVSIQVD